MARQQDSRGKRKAKSRCTPHRNPCRGAPGVLLTCETSRESKCRREGLDILKYYSEQFLTTDDQPEEEQQSLEDELKALKNKRTSEKSPFSVFETGCKGTVLFLFDPKGETKESDESKSLQIKEIDQSDGNSAKRQRLDTTSEGVPVANTEGETQQQFDAVEMVTRILRDTREDKSQSNGVGIPGSRFVTRIIPLQATCSVVLEDIAATTRKLTERFLQALPDEKKKAIRTFAVEIKRRICNNVKRMDMIDAVAGQVAKTAKELLGSDWKVDLTNPDVTVWVEVCKSICGIALVSKETLELSPNWNVAEMRATSQNTEDVDE